MFKLIFFLIGLVVAIVFSILNIGNSSTVSLGFKVMEDIPVFIITAGAFFTGALFTLPFAFYVSLGNRKKKKNESAARFAEDSVPDAYIPPEPDVSENE